MNKEEKYNEFIKKLFSLQDEKYLEFNKKIANSKDKMIGIRVPKLREISKDIAKSNIDEFVSILKYEYFEEKMILGLTIGYSNKIEIYDKYLLYFSTLITDWSICDSTSSTLKLIKKNNEHFIPLVEELLNSKNEFQLRFGIIILFDHYINDNYVDYVISKTLKIKSDYYYVNMALSWLYCELYIKYPNKIDKYINSKYLSKFVLNKTISKICDSYRITSKQKEELKKRRI